MIRKTVISLATVMLSVSLVVAQNVSKPTGAIRTGINFNSDYGWLGSLNYDESNFLQKGISVSAGLSAGDEYQVSHIGINDDLMLGSLETNIGFNLRYRSQAFDGSSLKHESLSLSPYMKFKLGEDFTVKPYLFMRSSKIYDLDETVSPLIHSEPQKRDAQGVGVFFEYSNTEGQNILEKGVEFSLGFERSGFGGDVETNRYAVSGAVYFPIGPIFASLSAKAGGIESLNDDFVSIHDRFFLGGSNLHGFSFGGVGPRDFEGNVNSALGGKRYYKLRLSLKSPVMGSERFFVGAFAEQGSVWDLDIVEGGALAVIDDSRIDRQSVGISTLVRVGGGFLELSYFEPTKQQDYDETQTWRFGFSRRF